MVAKSKSSGVTLSTLCTLTVSIHLIDHVLQFSLCGVLAQRPHDGAKLFGGDGAIAILVK